jgi:hypothetical protein
MPDPATESSEWSKSIKLWMSPALIALLVVVPCIFGVVSMPAQMGLATAAIIAALFFANVERFEKFKVAGMEAEVRKAVEQAYAAIEDLRELALALADPVMDTLGATSMLGSVAPAKYRVEQVSRIASNLRKLGATDKQISDAADSFHITITRTIVGLLWMRLMGKNPSKGQLFEMFNWNASDWDRKKFDAFISENSLDKDGEVDELLQDLTQFLDTKTLRRPDAIR